MDMTESQKQAVKAYILATPELAVKTSGESTDYQGIAEALNALATPDFVVRRTSISRHEILTTTSLEGTTFTWAGGGYITRSQGERDAFREMFNSTGSVDPRQQNIVNAFSDIFSGAGGASNRTHIDAVGKRKATVAEKVLATGTGSFASPAAIEWEGLLDQFDIPVILAS